MWINSILKREQLCCSRSNKYVVTGRENRNVSLLLLKYKKGVLVGDTRRWLNKYEFSDFFRSLTTDPSKKPSPSLHWHKLGPACIYGLTFRLNFLRSRVSSDLINQHFPPIPAYPRVYTCAFFVSKTHTYEMIYKPTLQTALNLTHGCGLTSKIWRSLCVRFLSAGRSRTDVGKYTIDTHTERKAACKDQVLLRKGQPSFPSGST